MEVDVGVRPVMERVAGEVRRNLHLELCMAVAGVAAEKVAAAPDLKA
jgi:hypothetical protein